MWQTHITKAKCVLSNKQRIE